MQQCCVSISVLFLASPGLFGIFPAWIAKGVGSCLVGLCFACSGSPRVHRNARDPHSDVPSFSAQRLLLGDLVTRGMVMTSFWTNRGWGVSRVARQLVWIQSESPDK